MERCYQNQPNAEVNFFFGKEVEKTPAFGLETLFVVGVQPIDTITELLNAESVQHIFFGANHSYDPKDYDEHNQWNKMIVHFLENGMLCSLDIPINQVEEFNDGPLCEYSNFIPQIRVAIPYVKLWNYNTMIKIDDKTFNYSNPGIWTHSLHNLMNRDQFTNWDQYKNDRVS